VGAVALLTDFGTEDWYVGSMKGVILGIAPQSSIVDISHQIPMGDIRAAAFSLLSCYASFPHGTVFAVVVDPGVGSDRRAVVARSNRYLFTAPDNGVLSPVLAREEQTAIRMIANPEMRLEKVSSTFHGRDIFAPAAAHLANGEPFEDFGPVVTDPITSHIPQVRVTDSQICGEVVYIDHFGNAITNIAKQDLPSRVKDDLTVTVSEKHQVSLGDHYDQVAPGQPLALIGSSGMLEISVNGGSAAAVLGINAGASVVVR
jgi:S-adenosylmethionine hydrolase